MFTTHTMRSQMLFRFLLRSKSRTKQRSPIQNLSLIIFLFNNVAAVVTATMLIRDLYNSEKSILKLRSFVSEEKMNLAIEYTFN